MAITASSSGRRTEPPSIVIVPSQLMTVVTPSSSYGFPLWPKPLTVLLPAVAATFEKSLRGAKIDPTIAAAVPRNPRRFQVEFSRMNSPRFYQRALLVSHSGNAIDFDQRVTRQCSDGYRRAGRPAMREIRPEHFVHAVPVLNLH